MAREPVKDFADALQILANRIYRLEQSLTNPSTFYNPNPIFDTIQIGDQGEVVIIDRSVEKPTGVTAGWGTFQDNVFIDVSWTPPAEHYVSAQVDLAVKDTVLETYSLIDTARVAGTTHRFNGLQPNRTYGVRVNGVSYIGTFTDDAAWVDVAVGEDSTIPPAVSNVVMVRGASSVVVKFTPLTEAQAWDVAMGRGTYRVQVDTSAAFNTGNLRESTDASFVRAFSDIGGTEQTWYARVAAIDSSGNQGPWVAATSITAGGVNDSMIVADLSAAKITAGSFSGDRITANTLDVGALKSSTLASKEITIGAGGVIKIGNPPTTGMFINSQGISLYAGGVLKVYLDATTGNGTFKGTVDASTITGSTISGNTISGGSIDGATITGGLFRTASSGARLEIDQSNQERVKFYGPSALQGTIGYRNSGWGAGLYITSVDHVYITNETGNQGTGSLKVYGLTFHYANCEWISAQQYVTAPNLITTSNIGSQSVNYANSSGSASSAGSANSLSGSVFTSGGRLFIPTDDQTTSAATAQVLTNGQVRRTVPSTSSIELKENVVNIEESYSLDDILSLRAVKFDYKQKPGKPAWNSTRKNHVGLIAEEVVSLVPELIERDQGDLLIRYDRVGVLLLPIVQRIVEKIGGLD